MTNILSYALTNLSDVKESLNIPSSTTKYDNLITRKINQATEMIESYCGRRFKQQSGLVEYYDASHGDTLVLKNRPVDTTAILTLEARDTVLNVDSFQTLDSEWYHLDENAGILELLFNAWGKWKQFRVTYTGGYSTIPTDLAEACVALACYLYNNADANVQIREKQEGQRRVQYWQGIKGQSDLFQQLGIDGILDNYANEPFSGSSQ